MTTPTNNELIEHNVRMALGDLMLQTILLKAKIAEFEARDAAQAEAPEAPPPVKTKEVHVNGQQQ